METRNVLPSSYFLSFTYRRKEIVRLLPGLKPFSILFFEGKPTWLQTFIFMFEKINKSDLFVFNSIFLFPYNSNNNTPYHLLIRGSFWFWFFYFNANGLRNYLQHPSNTILGGGRQKKKNTKHRGFPIPIHITSRRYRQYKHLNIAQNEKKLHTHQLMFI